MNQTKSKNYFTQSLHVMELCRLTYIIYWMDARQTIFSLIKKLPQTKYLDSNPEQLFAGHHLMMDGVRSSSAYELAPYIPY